MLIELILDRKIIPTNFDKFYLITKNGKTIAEIALEKNILPKDFMGFEIKTSSGTPLIVKAMNKGINKEMNYDEIFSHVDWTKEFNGKPYIEYALNSGFMPKNFNKWTHILSTEKTAFEYAFESGLNINITQFKEWEAVSGNGKTIFENLIDKFDATGNKYLIVCSDGEPIINHLIRHERMPIDWASSEHEWLFYKKFSMSITPASVAYEHNVFEKNPRLKEWDKDIKRDIVSYFKENFYLEMNKYRETLFPYVLAISKKHENEFDAYQSFLNEIPREYWLQKSDTIDGLKIDEFFNFLEDKIKDKYSNSHIKHLLNCEEIANSDLFDNFLYSVEIFRKEVHIDNILSNVEKKKEIDFSKVGCNVDDITIDPSKIGGVLEVDSETLPPKNLEGKESKYQIHDNVFL